MEGSKVCTKCGVDKSLDEFHKRRASNDGLGTHCKQCKKEYRKQLKRKRKGYKENYNVSKRCSNCHRDKPRNEFYRDDISKDGLRSRCKECERIKKARWDAENKERIRKYNVEYREKNQQKMRELRTKWRGDNIEKAKRLDAINNKKAVSNLSDKYIKNCIRIQTKLKTGQITHELIELKRQMILLYRANKELKKLQDKSNQ